MTKLEGWGAEDHLLGVRERNYKHKEGGTEGSTERTVLGFVAIT